MKNSSSRRAYDKLGNPFKRGKTWTYIYYITDPETGKKKPKWKGGFKTKKEAELALRQTESDITSGVYIEDKKTTVGQYLTNWISKEHKRNIETTTYNGYLVNIENHIIPNIGDIQIIQLNKTHINDMFDKLITDGLSPTTVKYVRNVLRKALNDAVGEDLIRKNPCLYSSLPKQTKYKAEVLNPSQVQKLFREAQGSNVELEILIAATLGLRRGEVLGLKFSDFDFDKKEVHIQRQVTFVKDRSVKDDETESETWGIKSLKTEGSDRTIYVPQSVIDSVLARRKLNAVNKLKFGSQYNDLDLVFCKEDGSCVSPQTVYHRFKKVLKKAGLPDIRFHDLRHSCASILLDMDVPLKTISDMLGHSSISTTANIYCDVLEKKRQPADTMQEILFNSPV